MNPLVLHLHEQRAAGIYHVTEVDRTDLAAVCQAKGIQFFDLDGSQVTNKPEFLRMAAQAMRFPEYFGYNWDALEDCLTDLNGECEAGYLVLYSHADRFATTDPEQWNVLLQILHSAIAAWQTTNTPMYVLLQSPLPLANLPTIA